MVTISFNSCLLFSSIHLLTVVLERRHGSASGLCVASDAGGHGFASPQMSNGHSEQRESGISFVLLFLFCHGKVIVWTCTYFAKEDIVFCCLLLNLSCFSIVC